jgi:hypothetical protein
MKLLRMQVSLDGATAATNDAIRGSGTFKLMRFLFGQSSSASKPEASSPNKMDRLAQ